jgi:ligand-binding sensor domain-containing protein/putative methionine-R-sulfoxide reductase with GAF domain
MCMDKMGNLWIATGEGLNMFNGKAVTKYFKAEYPQFVTDQGRLVVCDDNNRVWALSLHGNLTLIDEKRKVHRVTMMENDKPVIVKWVIKTKGEGVYLFTSNGSFALTPGKDITSLDSLTLKHFSKVAIAGFDTLKAKVFSQVMPFDEHSHIFSVADGFFKINFKEKKVEKKYSTRGLTVLAPWSSHELLVFDREKEELQAFDLATQSISYPLKDARDQFGKPLTGRIGRAKKINNEQFLLTVSKQGFYIFNIVTRQLHHYKHDAADPTSVINNSPAVIMADSSGWVFLGCSPHGISYFKNNAVIGQQLIFQDKLGNSYDGYVNHIATRDNDVYYIAVSNNLLEWKRSTNTTNFIDYASGTGESLMNDEGVSTVNFDKKDRLWIATGTKGIYILDKNKKLVKHITNDSTHADHVPRSYLWHMTEHPDGYMWISGREGICRVDVNTFKVDHFKDHPMEKIRKYDTHMMFFSDPDNVWIACRGKGLWHYQLSTKKLSPYYVKDGLLSDNILSINKDKFNNLYVGTNEGLSILLNNGKIKNITTREGLQSNRVEALLLDKNNRMWMGNDVGLSCFNIGDTSLRIFDQRYGLSIQGFRIFSYHQNSDDELVWGTERGIQYFYPDELLRQQLNLRSFIQRVETRHAAHDLTGNMELDLSSKDNALNFYFSSIEYSSSLRTFYRYKLEGEDEDWVNVLDQNSVRYSSLSPGKYTFSLQASNDGKDWKDAENTVVITIDKPMLQQWWVKLGGLLVGVLVIGAVINFYRRRQERKRNELEAELVITYFASQINRHQHTDELLWDVAKNCISKLQFEDCVIYLKDPSRDTMVQKAAYGPKNPVDFTIHQPLEIRVGEGIVGTVASTGKFELVANTEDDERYIEDDKRRYSEIAVPIIIDNEVIGVIDSEHSQKNFFTSRHLQILSTVAVLCANQIQRTRAEEEKQKTRLELLENKQKAMESRLQSLRLQMNPHFLFNALNSIQQMILANEDIVATKYLSRFSKLLRAILVHSDKETISLKEELEILKLYIELESIRFKDSFSYTIVVDEEIETEEVKIPTLLVQPFVENAIWHGLMHKEGERKLKVEFREEGDFIKCIIEDNGIGRKKATDMKMINGQDKKHTSKGIAVSKERLRTLKTGNGREGTVTIIDLEGKDAAPAGTRVEINFPVSS